MSLLQEKQAVILEKGAGYTSWQCLKSDQAMHPDFARDPMAFERVLLKITDVKEGGASPGLQEKLQLNPTKRQGWR